MYGGEIFEDIFDKLINVIKNIIIDGYTLFGFQTIFHIKGGASIYYHLKKNLVNETKDLTNDIDIFVIIDDISTEESFEQEKKNIIDNLIINLNKYLPEYKWISKFENNLYNICIDNSDIDIKNKCIFDITFYNPFDENIDVDDDTSIFQYAMRKSGYNTIKEYIDNLRKKFDDLDELKQNKNIIDIMFTSVDFERFACEKGIKLMEKYLDFSTSEWVIKLKEFKDQLKDKSLSKENIDIIQKFIKRLEYQTSDLYKHKLEDKLDRYKKKQLLLSFIKK